MENNFLLSRETCNKIESILASRYPNCRFRIGYSFLRDQQEISIGTFNADTNTVFGNDFGLRSLLEKAKNQQDFIDMLLEHASLQAESILKQSQQIQPKEITMTQCQPIETAPIECFGSSEEENPEILVYSRWDWGGMDREECSLEYSWRVAEYEDGHFWSVTSNPYRDKAFNPTHWMPLPPTPAAIEKGD